MQVVTTVTVNPRVKMQMAGLETAKNYEKEALDRIRRMSIAAAELEVKGSRKGLGHHPYDKYGGDSSGVWYEASPSA